jgi:hypothetical protein
VPISIDADALTSSILEAGGERRLSMRIVFARLLTGSQPAG